MIVAPRTTLHDAAQTKLFKWSSDVAEVAFADRKARYGRTFKLIVARSF